MRSKRKDAAGFGLLAGLALACAWIVASAVSRGRGGVVFASLAVALLVAAEAARRGRRRALYATTFLLLLGASLTLAAEGVLRIWPYLLKGHIANVAYGGYHAHAGGIYTLDDHRGAVMRPSVRRRMYWNGRWWWHTANAHGYRGPMLARADAVFLGDSMVYGHGVEDDETVAAFFTRRTGLAAANLGQQGTCQLQSLLAWRARGRALRPRYVFASVHYNDADDVNVVYPAEEQRRFREEPGYRPLAVSRYRPPARWDPVAWWAVHVSLPLRVGGLLGTVAAAARAGERARGGSADAEWELPTEADLARPFASEQPGWATEREALAALRRECAEAGARLVVFDLGYPRAFTAEVEAVARRIGAEYSTAGRAALARGQAGDEVYLRGDGHWTARGHDLVALHLAVLAGHALPPQAGVR